MAWPFSAVGAPNLDTGTGSAVPTSATAVTASACWLIGAQFSNPAGGSTATVTVTDTAGNLIGKFIVPPGTEQPYEWAFRPATGVKWSSDQSGVKGHIWGYI